MGALGSVGEGWWIAALVTLFPRDVPSSLTTSVIAPGSAVLSSRRRWQQSRGPRVPRAQPSAPAPLSMEGLSPHPCSSLGWATTRHRVLPCLSRPLAWGRSPGHPRSSSPGAHGPLQMVLVLEPERRAEALGRGSSAPLSSALRRGEQSAGGAALRFAPLPVGSAARLLAAHPKPRVCAAG